MGPNLEATSTRAGKSAERQSPRFKVDFSVKLTIGTPGSKTTVQCRAHDLGEGGLSIYAVAELVEGQQVQIEFLPPFSRRALELIAIVRDRSDHRYGLEFRKVKHDAAEELSRACRALSLAAH